VHTRTFTSLSMVLDSHLGRAWRRAWARKGRPRVTRIGAIDRTWCSCEGVHGGYALARADAACAEPGDAIVPRALHGTFISPLPAEQALDIRVSDLRHGRSPGRLRPPESASGRTMHPNFTIDWTIPPTAPGWGGRMERFMGPGKTRAETTVELVGGVLGIAAIVAVAATDEAVRAWSSLQIGLGAVLALDLVGGALTNATNSAKRWYHRPGPKRVRSRLMFLAAHVVHLAVVAFLLLQDGATWWWTHLILLAASSLLIEAMPVEVKRATAVAALVCAVALGQAIAPVDGVMALVPVLLYLKLVLGHLVPEAPLVERPPVASAGQGARP